MYNNELIRPLKGRLLWRVERVIILVCYLNCNSSIYIFVFIIFVTCSILNSSFSFYYSNVRLCFHHFNFSIFIAKFHDSYFTNFVLVSSF